MITIGVTGIIGSGKTTVSTMLNKAGYTVVDLDNLAKEVSDSAQVIDDIIKNFGKQYIKDDMTVDAGALRALVFKDKEHLKILEQIVHPRLVAEMEKRIALERQKGAKAVIIDGPLIFEKGLNKELDKTIVVSAQMNIIKERLVRRGMEKEDVERRIANQIPLEEKERLADYVVRNNGSEEDLRKELEILLEKIKTWEVEDTCILMN
ncbi:MAG TPA: dephospho-CoA kinase [Syntrophorhabdaceae bacterium]|jgi:dephospho-CoA kinase